jgi:hypothetical protein
MDEASAATAAGVTAYSAGARRGGLPALGGDLLDGPVTGS